MDDPTMENIFLENWMHLLAPKIADIKLKNLFIPGSHDANTSTISSEEALSAFARCQNIDVYKQASLGIRFFDLRYGFDKKTLEITDKHGPFIGTDFFQNFEMLKNFSEAHPDEFFIITVQSESEVDKNLKKLIIRRIGGILINKLILKKDLETWFSPAGITLREIWKRNKRFFLVAREELWTESGFDEEKSSKIGIHNPMRYLMNLFHNVADEEMLFLNNMNNLPQKDKNPDKFFSSQFVLTLQLDPQYVIKTIVTMDMPTIVNFVSKLHNCNKLPKLIFDNLNKPFNLFLFDFIDFDVNLQKIIISANISDRLKIHKIFFGDFDLTNVLEDEFVNEKLMYVPNVQQLAEKYQPKFIQFCVIYSYNGGNFQFKISQKECNSFLVFSNPIDEFKPQIAEKVHLIWRTKSKFKWKIGDQNISDHECDLLCDRLHVSSLIKLSGKTFCHYKYSANKK